jgi:U3 small nucleolar RNA-associated protein 13
LAASFAVSAGIDLTIKLWSLPSFESAADVTSPLPLQTVVMQRAHDKEVQSIAVSPNDKLIATGSRDKKAKVLEIAVDVKCKILKHY